MSSDEKEKHISWQPTGGSLIMSWVTRLSSLQTSFKKTCSCSKFEISATKKEPRTYCSKWEKERMWADGSLSTLLYSSKDISISMVNLYHHREQKKGSIQSKKLAQNLLKNFMFVRSTSPTMVSKMWKPTFVQNLCQVGHTKLIKLNIYESIPCSRQVEHGEQAGQMWGTPHQHW